MNVNDLMGADSDLLLALAELGLTSAQQDALGLLIGAQLESVIRTNLGDLLRGLSSAVVLESLDGAGLAACLDIDPATVDAALRLIAASITEADSNDPR